MKTYLVGIIATFAYALAIGANGVWRFVPDCAEGAFLCGGAVCAAVCLAGGLLAMGAIIREANESGKEG